MAVLRCLWSTIRTCTLYIQALHIHLTGDRSSYSALRNLLGQYCYALYYPVLLCVILYSIVLGVESIHIEGEYHGDLHTENIIIRKFGLEFDLKIIDLHHWGDSIKDNREEDIVKIIRIFYDILGGQKSYAKLPPSLKA